MKGSSSVHSTTLLAITNEPPLPKGGCTLPSDPCTFVNLGQETTMPWNKVHIPLPLLPASHNSTVSGIDLVTTWRSTRQWRLVYPRHSFYTLYISAIYVRMKACVSTTPCFPTLYTNATYIRLTDCSSRTQPFYTWYNFQILQRMKTSMHRVQCFVQYNFQLQRMDCLSPWQRFMCNFQLQRINCLSPWQCFMCNFQLQRMEYHLSTAETVTWYSCNHKQ